MPQKRLNLELLEKMAGKSGKPKQYLREQISRRAGKEAISSTAAQLVWAKQLGIGIANIFAKASQDVRDEVRSVGTADSPLRISATKQKGTVPIKRNTEAITAATIKSLLHDKELHARCKDLLQAKKHFDRVIREATTVLDDRLKKKTGIKNMNPENLVSKAINPDPAKAIIEVSAEKAEQEGIHSVCKGIMLAFRNMSAII